MSAYKEVVLNEEKDYIIMSKTLNTRMAAKPACTEQTWKIIVLSYLCLFLLIGLFMQPIPHLWEGIQNIIRSSGILVSDYYVIASPGAAFVNAALVALIGSIILMVNGLPFAGLQVAVIFTLFGFGLFGKNIISIIPILAGSYLYAIATKQSYRNIASVGLLATCLSPLGAYVALEMGLDVPIGFIASMCAGFLVPPLSKRFAKFYDGFNLYNVGFTAGVTGLLILSVFRMFGYNSSAILIWGEQFNPLMRWICLPIFLSMIMIGLWFGGKANYPLLLRDTGVAPCDFIDKYGYGSTLINMGLMGLLGMLYIELAGAHYNGPTVGGLFTMAGFAACGKQPKAAAYVMLGIFIAGHIYPATSVAAPGAIVAALYGTTLSPIGGRYGIFAGALAGACHLAIVLQVGVLHGGMNLYNNGFAGGFVAIIFIAIMQALEEVKKNTIAK